MTDVLVLKSTLLYSNPQIIRVFRIDSRADVALLLKTISIVHGWKKAGQLRLMLKSSNKQHPSTDEIDGVIRTSISETMPLDGLDFTDAIVRMPMDPPDNSYNSTYYRSYETTVQGYWVFRIELLDIELIDDKADNDENVGAKSETDERICPPELIRYRSYHPFADCSSMKECNKCLSELENNGRIYRYGIYDDTEFVVDKEEINSQLLRLTGFKNNKKTVYKIDMEKGLYLRLLLKNHTVAEMKRVIRENMFVIPSNLRKDELIDELTCEYDAEEFWEMILRYMDIKEYLGFKEFVSDNPDKENNNYSYSPVLNSYCLTINKGNGMVKYIPVELLEYYEQMMSESGDEKLIAEKLVDAAVKVCGRLYGIFNRTACYKVYCTMCPFEKNDEVFGETWDEYIAESSTRSFDDYDQQFKKVFRYGVLNNQFLFSVNDITREQAEKIVKDKTYQSIDYYVPEAAKAEVILEKGIEIETAYYKAVIGQLRKLRFTYYYVKDYDTPTLLLLRYLHAGASGSEAVKKICNSYFRQEKQVIIESIVNTVNEARKHVRIIQLKGHTINELGGNLVINRQTY